MINSITEIYLINFNLSQSYPQTRITIMILIIIIFFSNFLFDGRIFEKVCVYKNYGNNFEFLVEILPSQFVLYLSPPFPCLISFFNARLIMQKLIKNIHKKKKSNNIMFSKCHFVIKNQFRSSPQIIHSFNKILNPKSFL